MTQFPHLSEVSFFSSVDEETNEAWDNTCNSFDNYEELKENIYSKELEQLALNSIQVCLFVTITTLHSKWFEPRSINTSYSVIVRVSVVLKRTVVGDNQQQFFSELHSPGRSHYMN